MRAGRFVTPGCPPIVICTQSVLPVRVRDGAAIGIHRQRVDCARVGEGLRLPLAVRTWCHVMSRRAVLCRVTSHPVALRRVASRKAATTH